MRIKGIFETYSGGKQLWLLLCFLLGGTLLAEFCTTGIHWIGGCISNEWTTGTGYLRTIQGLSALCTFLLPAIAMGYCCSPNLTDYLSLRRVNNPLAWPLTAAGMVLLAPLINLLSLWNQSLHLPAALAPVEQTMRQWEELAEQLTQTLLSSDRIDILLANLFVVAILAALTEECFFRGTLQRILSRFHAKPHVVIWTAAILFSAFHLQFYGFFPRMLLGAYFGYLLLWSRSIWLPIFAHFINNAIAVITLSNSALQENYYLTGEVPANELLPYSLFALLSTGLFIGINHLLRRQLSQ